MTLDVLLLCLLGLGLYERESPLYISLHALWVGWQVRQRLAVWLVVGMLGRPARNLADTEALPLKFLLHHVLLSRVHICLSLVIGSEVADFVSEGSAASVVQLKYSVVRHNVDFPRPE